MTLTSKPTKSKARKPTSERIISSITLLISLFGTEGASFDRIRLSANVTFNDSEVMYLDGLRVVGAGTSTSSDEADDSLEVQSYEAEEADDKQYDL
jgi:hypothetical protein